MYVLRRPATTNIIVVVKIECFLWYFVIYLPFGAVFRPFKAFFLSINLQHAQKFCSGGESSAFYKRARFRNSPCNSIRGSAFDGFSLTQQWVSSSSFAHGFSVSHFSCHCCISSSVSLPRFSPFSRMRKCQISFFAFVGFSVFNFIRSAIGTCLVQLAVFECAKRLDWQHFSTFSTECIHAVNNFRKLSLLAINSFLFLDFSTICAAHCVLLC